MPSDPVRRPVTSLRRVMAAAAVTENRAAERFLALWVVAGDRSGATARLMRKSYSSECVLMPDGHHFVEFWTLRVFV
jgi:hypothetical protein